jgi:hypothetical protein
VRFQVMDESTGQQVARTYSAVPADLERTVLRRQGLGSWIKLLEDAKDDAAEGKKPMSWGRVLYPNFLAEGSEAAS